MNSPRREVAIKVLPDAANDEKDKGSPARSATLYGFEQSESPQPERSASEASRGARAVPPSAASLSSGGLARPKDGRIAKKVGPRGSEGSVHFLIMELAHGETLAERLRRGRKPANIKVTSEGKVKVLDTKR